MAPVCISCQRSKLTNNFLLKCISCAHFWHHRCHSPPVPDAELVDIIKAYNRVKDHRPNATLVWKCGACREGKPRVQNPSQASGSSLNASSRAQSAQLPKHEPISNTKDDPIVIDDDDEDDEIQIVEPHGKSSGPVPSISAPQSTPGSTYASTRPPTKSIEPTKPPGYVSSVPVPQPNPAGPGSIPASQRRRQTQAKKVSSSQLPSKDAIRIIDDPISFPDPIPRSRPGLQNQASTSSVGLVSGLGHLSVSDRQQTTTPVQVVHTDPRTSLPRSTPTDAEGTPSQRGSTTPLPTRLARPSKPSASNDRIIKPEPAASPERTTSRTPSAPLPTRIVRQSEGASQAQEQAPAPPPVPPRAPEPRPHFHPALLPHRINARYDPTTDSTKQDIWQRAASRRLLKASAPAASNRSVVDASAASGSGSSTDTAPISVSRRKKFIVKAKESSGDSTLMISQTPFFFTADVWMKEKEEALASTSNL